MHLTHLQLVDFRSYHGLELKLEPGTSVFVGSNGQGKTNLVEAVGYLATLGSHRVANDTPLVRAGAARAVVRARIVRGDRAATIELELVPGKANRARLNSSALPRPRDVLGVLCTVLFAPEDLALVKGDPAGRRRFLDDLLVARTPRIAGLRADYERVLKQRSALLRSAGAARRAGGAGDLRTLDAWDGHLARHGADLLLARLALVAELRPRVARAYAAIAGVDGLTGFDYRASVPLVDGQPAGGGTVAGTAMGAGVLAGDTVAGNMVVGGTVPGGTAADGTAGGYAGGGDTAGGGTVAGTAMGADAVAGDTVGGRMGTVAAGAMPARDAVEDAMLAELARARKQEIDRGVCLVGPHRDELALSIGGLPARGYASHGESWSLALALQLASFELLRDDGRDPVLLLDDVFAELDTSRRARLAELVAPAEQVLVTAAVAADVPAGLAGARFTVADGRVDRVG